MLQRPNGQIRNQNLPGIENTIIWMGSKSVQVASEGSDHTALTHSLMLYYSSWGGDKVRNTAEYLVTSWCTQGIKIRHQRYVPPSSYSYSGRFGTSFHLKTNQKARPPFTQLFDRHRLLVLEAASPRRWDFDQHLRNFDSCLGIGRMDLGNFLPSHSKSYQRRRKRGWGGSDKSSSHKSGAPLHVQKFSKGTPSRGHFLRTAVSRYLG